MDQGLTEQWLRVIHPGVQDRLGRIRYVLFDFDGTLSVLRQGWEAVMIPLMVEAIAADPFAKTANAFAETATKAPADDLLAEVEQEVRAYVDRSSGTLTIRQMQWLAETVRRYGLAREVRSAGAYKALYLQRLMLQAEGRIQRLASGASTPAENLVAGAQDFVRGLAARGLRLYLASGTDHSDVMREASALGLLPFFGGGVFGALDGSEEHAKERVIQRILDENNLVGEELLVVGDGPVEIREGAARGALTLGVASDEVIRSSWNASKVARLVDAGADMIIADFREAEKLVHLFCG